MAKLGLTKLGLKVNQDIKTIEYNGQNIEIKQYLPINEKLELISNAISQAHDQNNFSNPIKLEIFIHLELIQFYTNINLTDKQKEDIPKLYDLFKSTGLLDIIILNIPKEEYMAILDGAKQSADAVYTYRNSIMGILETVSQDYENMDLDITTLKDKLADPNNMSFLKDVISKMG